MIVILDFEMGNTGSIRNMISRVGGESVVSSDRSVISNASGLILPGVGAFDSGMASIRRSDFISDVQELVLNEKVPILGVCLGMQVLFDSSEEGHSPGLGWIPGKVKKFNFSCIESKAPNVPNMGWNHIETVKESSLLTGVDSDFRFYFVHSYHVVCEEAEHEIAVAEYGYKFTCCVQRENIMGVQFHPEKSHRFGYKLFENFLALI
jgi:glutamine amidotransferase